MNDLSFSQKKSLCERLMADGIEGCDDRDAVFRAGSLTDLAIELEREDALNLALSWYALLEKRALAGDLAVVADYGHAIAIAGTRYRTDWTWEQPSLSRETFLLRRAVSSANFASLPDSLRCLVLNNLGNRLRTAGRLIEALGYWRRVLAIDPTFGMALCNNALALATYAAALEDTGKQALFLWVAYQQAATALSARARYTDRRDDLTREAVRTLKKRIESSVDLQGITQLDPLEWPDTSETTEERSYRGWTVLNYLYLNPSNDLGPISRATIDSLRLPSHVVAIEAPDIFSSVFDQMKQEYVSARWMLYEGLKIRGPHFSDKEVSLGVTEPRPVLSLAIEKVKASYRTAYSIFDKIGFFVNSYMDLEIPEKQVSFRRLWRCGENQSIRTEFDQRSNWCFCALYWMAKDFLENENDDVAEPQARNLSEIRNNLEHRYLRVTANDSNAITTDKLALVVTREQFEAKALHLLQLARAALIYVALGVGFEERRREVIRGRAPIPEIPSGRDFADNEKI